MTRLGVFVDVENWPKLDPSDLRERILRSAQEVFQGKANITCWQPCMGDISLVAQALQFIKSYEVFVLLSGDGDFLTLVEYLKEQGKQFWLVCPKGKKPKCLLDLADAFWEEGRAKKK